LTTASALASVACGGASDDHPEYADFDAPVESTAAEPQAEPTPTGTAEPEKGRPAACVEGDVKECRIPLPSQGSVKNCFVGVRTCTGGVWSACQDPIRID
jgi:hypothetical protein